jgi:hypothetical protein
VLLTLVFSGCFVRQFRSTHFYCQLVGFLAFGRSTFSPITHHCSIAEARTLSNGVTAVTRDEGRVTREEGSVPGAARGPREGIPKRGGVATGAFLFIPRDPHSSVVPSVPLSQPPTHMRGTAESGQWRTEREQELLVDQPLRIRTPKSAIRNVPNVPLSHPPTRNRSRNRPTAEDAEDAE